MKNFIFVMIFMLMYSNVSYADWPLNQDMSPKTSTVVKKPTVTKRTFRHSGVKTKLNCKSGKCRFR